MANPQNPGGSNRGFAAMDPAKQRQIASMGGKAAHLKGAAHEFTPAEAREAGRKGGLNSHGRKNANNANANAAAAQATQSNPQQSANHHPQPQMTQQSEPRQQQQDEQRHPHGISPSTPQQS